MIESPSLAREYIKMILSSNLRFQTIKYSAKEPSLFLNFKKAQQKVSSQQNILHFPVFCEDKTKGYCARCGEV